MKLSVWTLWKCHPFTMFGYPIVTSTWPNRRNSGQSERSISIKYPRSSWIGLSGRTLIPSMRSMASQVGIRRRDIAFPGTLAGSGRGRRRSAVIMEGQGLSRGRDLLTAVRIRNMQLKIVLGGEGPVGIAFNKSDRADSMAIGPEETAWLRKEFPAAPMFLTSARTGQGVEDAFSTIVSLTVDAVLAKGRASRTGRLFRQRILLFIAGRGSLGMSKAELFSEFKAVLPAQIMEELDNLVRLEALALDPSGTKTFVKAAEAPGTTRYWATDRGKRIAESPKGGDELAIEEIV